MASSAPNEYSEQQILNAAFDETNSLVGMNLGVKLDATNDSITTYPLGHSVATYAADQLVKTGAGVLHTLTFSCNDAAPTAGSIIAYDNTAESGSTVLFNHTFTTTPFVPFTVTIDGAFATGLYLGFTTTNDVNVTVSWR